METQETVTISKELLQRAYRVGNPSQKLILEKLFNKDTLKSNVMDYVKNFYDAMFELDEEHPFVKEWKALNSCSYSPDLEAYLRLRIIVTVLNEGWEPQFTEDEKRWYPWYFLYTADELNAKSDEWKRDHCVRAIGEKPSGYAGFAYANSVCDSSSAYASIGSRLCLKSEELAEYCGKQFIDLWKDFYYSESKQNV